MSPNRRTGKLTKKTFTFTIHHDRCSPGDWKPRDILALEEFIQTGNLNHAAHLSRLGMQLVLSEHHETLGGTDEMIGIGDSDGNFEGYEYETFGDENKALGLIAELGEGMN